MFVKETGGPVDALWPLFSCLAVLMERQSNRKERTMNTGTMYRANVRRVKRHPNAIRADRAAQAPGSGIDRACGPAELRE